MIALRIGLPPLENSSIPNEITTQPRITNDSGRIQALRSLLSANPPAPMPSVISAVAPGRLRDGRRIGLDEVVQRRPDADADQQGDRVQPADRERADAQALDEALGDEHPERDEEEDERRALGEVAADVGARHREGERHGDEEHHLPEQGRRADDLARSGAAGVAGADVFHADGPPMCRGGRRRECESNGAHRRAPTAEPSAQRLGWRACAHQGVLCAVAVTFAAGRPPRPRRRPSARPATSAAARSSRRRRTSSGPATRSSPCARCPSAGWRSRRRCAAKCAGGDLPVATKIGADGSFSGRGQRVAVARARREGQDDLHARRRVHGRARGRGHAVGDAREDLRPRRDEDLQDRQDRLQRPPAQRRARRPRRAPPRALLRRHRPAQHRPAAADRRCGCRATGGGSRARSSASR